ncbi:MAG: GIY-YIG nuclease family protein, partial [Rhodospirillales bacterium]|nr:GIY-YIG nuclease family protein [Rhodospirillales bacterium]
MRKQFAVYILTDRPRGVLYTGMSSSLEERVRQHREGLIEGFSRQYHVKRLVYFEHLNSAAETIAREKRLKRCAGMEDRADREGEPHVARSLAGSHRAITRAARHSAFQPQHSTRHPGIRDAVEDIRDLPRALPRRRSRMPPQERRPPG